MRVYKLPRKTLTLWQIRAAVIWLLLSAVCGFYSITMHIFVYLLSVLAVIFAVVIFWYIPKFFSGCKVKYLSGAVVIEMGVIIKTTHILPFSRLIYTQTLVTPVSKALGLRAVTLKAARSRVFIPEMLKGDLDELIEAISKGDDQ